MILSNLMSHDEPACQTSWSYIISFESYCMDTQTLARRSRRPAKLSGVAMGWAWCRRGYGFNLRPRNVEKKMPEKAICRL